MIARALVAAGWLAGVGAAEPRAPELPEDLGAETIDVSGYPADLQEVYRQMLLKVYEHTRGGVARVLNSPLIELDPRGEAILRREHPALFREAGLAEVSVDGWRREVMRQKNRPPCCGACPVLSMDDARRLWRFLVYDSIRRKTGANADAWIAYRRGLIARFQARRQP